MRLLLTVISLVTVLGAGQARKPKLPILPYASLAGYIADVKQRLPRSGSEGFIEPTAAEREAFTAAMRTALYGWLPLALLASLNYEAAYLRDDNLSQTYLVIAEKQNNARGLGTYILRTRPRRNIVLEVPHPLFDLDTSEESARIMVETGALGLFISGTHRCANAALSPCSDAGSSACNDETRVSDAAHFTRNFFHAAHRATLELRRPPVVLSIHGNAVESLPDVVLSAGMRQNLKETALVNRLRAALKARGVNAGSCNSSADNVSQLCGGSNVQGRLSNGSTDECTRNASSPSGLFLHVEQHLNIRREPSQLIGALKEVFQ